VAGLWEAYSKLGSKRIAWPDLLAPAVALAERGFTVDAVFANTIARSQAHLARYPASAALFLPNGAPPAHGSTWRNPDLAAVLRRIADSGPAGFYDGPVAGAIASAMKANLGLISLDDLKSYRTKWRKPFEYDYRGRKIVGMPLPSSGGLTMALIAHLLSAYDLPALGWHSPQHIHVVAEAMRRAFAARNAALGDPDFVQAPVSALLLDAWTQRERSTIRMDRATPTKILFPSSAPASAEGPNTTHLSVVDAEGSAVAMTTTVNAWFGSGVTVPGLGFVLNDEMDDFSIAPGTANMFGLVQGEANAIAPGKRMLSSMSPTIVLGPDGGVALVLGSAGGSRIISTVFQELSNVLDFGFAPSDAVRAPRFHQQDLPDVLQLEVHALPLEARQALEKMGHVLGDLDSIADAPAIGSWGGLWDAVAEPRREGSLALGF
jgi:gamma-glutamyltranspeptidase/glutathione hydrolase